MTDTPGIMATANDPTTPANSVKNTSRRRLWACRRR